MPSHLPISSVRRSSGVFSGSTAATSSAILPNSRAHAGGAHDRLAAAVGHGRPGEDHVPAVAHRRLARRIGAAPCRPAAIRRSAAPRRTAASGSRRGARRPGSCRRPRAPACRRARGPATRSRAPAPPRSTVIIGASMLFSASSARSARYSWTKPSTAQNRTMTQMMTASTYSPTQRRQDRRDDQDDDQDVLELVEEQHPGRSLFLVRELVRAVLAQTAPPPPAKAPQRIDLEFLQGGVDLQRMPRASRVRDRSGQARWVGSSVRSWDPASAISAPLPCK